ncbi:hypothetical protein [Caenispirillum bisanense]|uniref:Uncharacterized protein n=1 Tax=Caenispirillum bisanense TaxID=414052 RepID=A0A286GZQ4_9PROT|nr:hypothetical protein [Caenispirillum bisanense]SOE00579.1 hypothetical protein SAMN05421508_11346 [Caenispirillum bisanense]
MALQQWLPIIDRVGIFAVSLGGVAIASQVAVAWTTLRARANGATRTEARARGRDAGIVTLLVAVLLLATAATLGLWEM